MSDLQKKLDSTQADIKTVSDNIVELQELRQRLLGRAVTLEELIKEETPEELVADDNATSVE